MPNPSAPLSARRHLAWIVPLVLVPVLFFGFILIAGALQNLEDAVWNGLWLVPYVAALVTPIIALVIAAIAGVRVAVATRAAGAGKYQRLAQQDADRRGLTLEEYGVYKGSEGSLVRPVNSAGGLLVLSIILTVLGVFVLVFIGIAFAQDAGLIGRASESTEFSPVMWAMVILSLLFIPVSWRYYVIERRAQKLRMSRGLPQTLR